MITLSPGARHLFNEIARRADAAGAFCMPLAKLAAQSELNFNAVRHFMRELCGAGVLQPAFATPGRPRVYHVHETLSELSEPAVSSTNARAHEARARISSSTTRDQTTAVDQPDGSPTSMAAETGKEITIPSVRENGAAPPMARESRLADQQPTKDPVRKSEDALIDFGVPLVDAQRLAAKYPAERIAEKLAMTRDLKAQGSPLVNPAPWRYLVRAIERDYRHGVKAEPEPLRPVVTPAPAADDPEATLLWERAQAAIQARFSWLNHALVLQDARLVRVTGATAFLEPRLAMRAGCHHLLGPLGEILSAVAGRELTVRLVERPP